MHRFGSKVSVIEHHDRILSNEDPDVSGALAEILSTEGIEFYTSASISEVRGLSGDQVTLIGTRGGQSFELSGTHLLVAAGRTPNTDGIGLEQAGIEITAD